MLTPPKGNVDYVPVNAEGRRVAQEWDPAKDEAAGESCKAYGPVGLMRLPGRLHITWQDSSTLKIEIDNGTQTRLCTSARARPPAANRSRRFRATRPRSGNSRAAAARPASRARPAQSRHDPDEAGLPAQERRALQRRRGVDRILAQLTDDDEHPVPDVTTMLDDPTYLQQPWVRTSQFRRQADAKGWNPTPCTTR